MKGKFVKPTMGLLLLGYTLFFSCNEGDKLEMFYNDEKEYVAPKIQEEKPENIINTTKRCCKGGFGVDFR